MSRPDGYLVDDLDAHDVIVEVARGFKVTAEDILGRDRSPRVHMARVCAMTVVRQWAGLSYPEVGALFNRDHTTVMYAVKKVLDDPELSRCVRLVVDELAPAPRLFAVTPRNPHGCSTSYQQGARRTIVGMTSPEVP